MSPESPYRSLRVFRLSKGPFNPDEKMRPGHSFHPPKRGEVFITFPKKSAFFFTVSKNERSYLCQQAAISLDHLGASGPQKWKQRGRL